MLLGDVIGHAAEQETEQHRRTGDEAGEHRGIAAHPPQERQQRIAARQRAVEIKAGDGVAHSDNRLKIDSGTSRITSMISRQKPGR